MVSGKSEAIDGKSSDLRRDLLKEGFVAPEVGAEACEGSALGGLELVGAAVGAAEAEEERVEALGILKYGQVTM